MYVMMHNFGCTVQFLCVGAKFVETSEEFKITECDGTTMKLEANSSVHHLSVETQERCKQASDVRTHFIHSLNSHCCVFFLAFLDFLTASLYCF